MIAWYVVIFSINTTSDIWKIWHNFEISLVVFMPNVTYKSCLLFVYTTTHKRFVIFTFGYFKLSWNTTALSQSNCRNFSCSCIMESYKKFLFWGEGVGGGGGRVIATENRIKVYLLQCSSVNIRNKWLHVGYIPTHISLRCFHNLNAWNRLNRNISLAFQGKVRVFPSRHRVASRYSFYQGF